jgi:RNA polymerase sigma factor (sigma-70 family)
MQSGAKRLAAIYAAEKARFLRFIDRQLFDDDALDSEDILSEVFSHLLHRSALVDEIENLSAYIYRSLANRITDHRRKAVPVVTIDGAPEEEGIVLPDTRPHPEQMLTLNELQRRLSEAIDGLGVKERAVWIATEIDGRAFNELAEEWDEPIGTLLSRKSRATAKLRLTLADYINHKELS